MIATAFIPTDEQKTIVERSGSAFVTACPGAGKTRTMVERAKRLLTSSDDRRGVAFLSFTTAAVDELEARLRAFEILPTPLFPSFIGTFDSFLWHFFLAPFGVPGCDHQPRLIPDKEHWKVRPNFTNAQELDLRCFDRQTAKIIPAIAAESGFDVTKRNPNPYETIAAKILLGAWEEGKVDFDDVRTCVADRLSDTAFANRLGAALAARFREVVVDEAQDCNPADLDVVGWLRAAGIPVNVICDPNQAIYEFRGGVTDELRKFSDQFSKADQLGMTGNFRSTPAICAAIAMLRAPADRGSADLALGPLKSDGEPVHIVSYAGKKVPSAVGAAFTSLLTALNLPFSDCPVVSSRRETAFNAIGQPPPRKTGHATLMLAEALTNFHFSFAVGDRRAALVALHRVVLSVQGHLADGRGYHHFVSQPGRDRGEWRPDILEIARDLKLADGETPDQWLGRARTLLEPTLVGTTSVATRLRKPSDWEGALTAAPVGAPPARTIHSVKGLEFPAVCVVMTSAKSNGILTYLEGGTSSDNEEDARKIYVAASRAQRLLTIAIPKSQADRLNAHLQNGGCTTVVHQA